MGHSGPRFLDRRYRNYFLNPVYWVLAVKRPGHALKNLAAAIRYPRFYRISRSVEGLISLNLCVLLYETVLRSRSSSPNIVEVGAYKGLSTVFLSRAAARVGKRVKSFELFSGLPEGDPELDPPLFSPGRYSSDRSEFEANVSVYGCREVVDLFVEDARGMLTESLGEQGFAVAFLDADLYDVTRTVLLELWSIARGGEVIIVHDAWSPGVRKAIDEFHRASGHCAVERIPEPGTVYLSIPPALERRAVLEPRYDERA